MHSKVSWYLQTTDNLAENTFLNSVYIYWAMLGAVDLVGSHVKNLSTLQQTKVRSLGWEDPLKKGMATHSSILAWRIPWTEEPGKLQSRGLQTIAQDWATNTHTHTPGAVDTSTNKNKQKNATTEEFNF